MLSDIKRITGYRHLCVSGHGMDDRSQDKLVDTVDKLNCQLQWSGQVIVCTTERIPVDLIIIFNY